MAIYWILTTILIDLTKAKDDSKNKNSFVVSVFAVFQDLEKTDASVSKSWITNNCSQLHLFWIWI